MSGRRGNPNFVKKTENKEEKIDIKSLDQEALLQYVEQLQAQLNSQQEFDEDELIIIPDETKVELKSNVEGTFILREDRGKANIFKPFAKYGDTTRVSYGDLNLIYGAKPEFFRKGKLAITRIYSESKKYTIEQVYRDLGLESVYLDENRVNPVTIESIFDDRCSEREFEKLVSNSPDMAELILEVAVHLYKAAKFNNSTKQAFLKQVFANPNLFR